MGTILMMTDGFGKVRKIGNVNGQTLRKKCNRKEHFFRKLDAWCFDKDAFLQHTHIQVFIVEEEDGSRYLAPREAFEQYAETINYPGHGEQLALPLKYWEQFKE